MKITELLGIQNDKAKAQVLGQCNERWKAFKTTLRSDYMDMGKSPCEIHLKEKKWLQFVAKEKKVTFLTLY